MHINTPMNLHVNVLATPQLDRRISAPYTLHYLSSAICSSIYNNKNALWNYNIFYVFGCTWATHLKNLWLYDLHRHVKIGPNFPVYDKPKHAYNQIDVDWVTNNQGSWCKTCGWIWSWWHYIWPITTASKPNIQVLLDYKIKQGDNHQAHSTSWWISPWKLSRTKLAWIRGNFCWLIY